MPFSEFQNIKFCCSVDFFLSVFLTATVVFLRFQFQDYTSLFETFGLILLISVYALSCQTTNFMGCLPLANLHHFCLTKGFSKTPNAVCILHWLDCALCVVYYHNGRAFMFYWEQEFFCLAERAESTDSWADGERELRTLRLLCGIFDFGMRSYFGLVFTAHVLLSDRLPLTK